MSAVAAALDAGDGDGVLAAMSDAWLDDCTLSGPVGRIREGVEAWFGAGVTESDPRAVEHQRRSGEGDGRTLRRVRLTSPCPNANSVRPTSRSSATRSTIPANHATSCRWCPQPGVRSRRSAAPWSPTRATRSWSRRSAAASTTRSCTSPAAMSPTGCSQASTRRPHCPLKGDTEYFDLVVGADRHADAAWSYVTLVTDNPLQGLIAFDPAQVRVGPADG